MGKKPSEERDRRRHPRKKLKVTVRYKTIDKFKTEYAQNISHGGIFVKSSNPLPIHSRVEVSIEIPELEPIILNSRVVRIVGVDDAKNSDQKPGFALEFIDLDEKKGQMEDFIKSVSDREVSGQEAVIQLGPPPSMKRVDESISQYMDTMEVEDETDYRGEEGKERQQHRSEEVRNMTVKEKMLLAPRADRIDRALLMKDLNPNVARLLLRNPRITDQDIIRMAKNIGTPADVLEGITKNRKWISNQEVRTAIVKNPRTPTPLAIRQMPYLMFKELTILAKGQNVKDTIKREAVKLVTKQREKGR